ncbi:DUF3971 domain-containing protein [Caenispirillum bisanense]|uniref:YhdP central domain-containing protein n=1 Tax=Caenispirillum bisanense TaxID=414052 RepID=A0A286G293_9PROT|nr:DUF3971 domain-containing protein [Caenispirillum bisanense]SOD89299.1 Protein of unknown function [Caenispirillum bisanense]
MVHGAVKWLFKGLAGLAFLLLVIGAGIALRLSQGPLSLDLLTPYVEEAVNDPDAAVRIGVGGTALHWGGLDAPFDLRVRDIRATDRSGALIAQVPEASLTVDPRPYLRDGTLAIDAVTLRGPEVALRREADGSVTLAMGDAGRAAEQPAPAVEHHADTVAGAVRAVLRELGLDDGGSPPALALPQVLRIADARIVLDDRMTGMVWRVPEADAVLRREADRLAAEASLRVATPDGTGTTTLDLVAYLERGGVIDAGLTLRDLRPADFAAADERLADLAGFDLPLSGTLTATASLDGDRVALDLLTASLSAKPGVLVLPDPVQHAYEVDRLALHLSAADDLRHVVLDSFTLGLGGTTVGLQAALERTAEGVSATADVTLDRVETDRLPQLWPAAVADGARDWIDERLADGAVTGLTLHAAVAGADFDTLALTALEGRADVQGVTVDYLPPMPKVREAAAELVFAPEAVTLVLSGGKVFDLAVTGGTLTFGGLAEEDQTADIALTVEGPVLDALRLVDSEPLGYVSRYGLPLKGVKGRQVTDLHLAFPLLSDLDLDDLKVKAVSRLKGVALPKVAFDQDLSEGSLALEVDTEGLVVEGDAALGGVPAVVKWEENFTGKGPFTGRYTASAVLDDAERARFGLDIIPFTKPFTTGPAGASVILTVLPGGTQTLGATIDLTAADMRLPGFGWHKPAGEAGTATLAGRLDKAGQLQAINHFTVTAGTQLAMTGQVDMTDEGTLDHVAFADVRVGETRLAGGLTMRPDGGLDVEVRGASLDAVPFLEDRPMGASDSAALPEEEGTEESDLPPLSLRAQFDVVWVTEDSTMESVVAHMIRDEEGWTSMDIRGLAEGQEPVAFDFRPLEAGSPNRAFTLDSGNAGTVLRALNVIDNVEGGRLRVEGAMDALGNVTGVARIGDFRLVRAPALAKILSVAALTGILESLTGEGLFFQSATVPFTYVDGMLRLSDARANGPSLGFTAEGAMDLRQDRMDMQGTIVPAYALNSLLGSIPIVGDLLTGGDKGGGIFAATYTVTGPLDDPDASVNPLSVLAPGILRKIFEGEAAQTVRRPEDGPPPGGTTQ